MEHWNIENSRHLLDRKSEQGHNPQHPDFHNASGSLANYSHQYVYPVMYPYAMNVKSQDQLGAIQFYHHVPSYDLNGAPLYNCYNPGSHNAYLLPSTRDFFAPLNNGSAEQFAQSAPTATGVITNEQFPLNTPVGNGIATNEHSGNFEFTDSHRLAYKRKQPEVVTGDHYLANVPANPDLSSTSSRLVQPVDLNENEFNLTTPAAFTSTEYLDNIKSPTEGAMHGSESSKYSSINLQQQPEVLYNDYTGQAFEPSSFTWVEQQENYFHGGCYYNWNYMNPASYVNGRHLQSGAMESMNMHTQEYPALVLHPPALPNQHHHLPSVQSMQVHSHNQNTQTAAPSYWRPVSNLQSSNAHPSDVNSANRSPRHSPFITEEFNWSLPEAAEEYEDADDSYSDSVSDQHGDMRLDIEDMSYEELLVLEEQIGHVNTGLSEDSILKNLKTSVCAPLTLSLLDLSSRLLNEKCVICLVGYEEQERIGTLDCGHCYHADCIKEWLLIKNQCPICKASALASDRKE
ncbi:E3 ubiquitin-protein ligase Arkadia-like [Iris pallida]|uniref:RING-type E3 ubiquitin transferase n=1 Tax=Iris pallida TaxID=29817 RepID=A0AAX6GZN1_IRIPA|nr:E3 ubiquitin-protein ligase Arkadia-like [Iris pallida]